MAPTRNKKTIAYEAIKRQIINIELPPGLPINEAELASQLGVSKTPIREALRQLERDGFVENVPSRGSMISHITSQEITDVFQIREIIESGAAKRAALFKGNDDLSRQRDQCEQILKVGPPQGDLRRHGHQQGQRARAGGARRRGPAVGGRGALPGGVGGAQGGRMAHVSVAVQELEKAAAIGTSTFVARLDPRTRAAERAPLELDSGRERCLEGRVDGLADVGRQGTRRRQLAASGPLPERLTSREWEVLELLAQERSTAQIARHLSLSQGAVRSHIAAIVHKLGVADPAAAARDAVLAALASPELTGGAGLTL